jgi:hypothetical protein
MTERRESAITVLPNVANMNIKSIENLAVKELQDIIYMNG